MSKEASSETPVPADLDDDLWPLLLQDAQLTFDQENHGDEADEVLDRVKSLQSELVKEFSSRSWCELRLKRIEMGKVLCDNLFKEEKDGVQEQSIKNNLEKLELAPQIIRIEKEIKDLQKKLDEQNNSNHQLKAENIELLGKLKENRERQTLAPEVTRNKEYKRLKSELNIQCQSVTIYKNIIQRLIVGLGVDLDQDEELQDLVEKCGENSKF